MKTVFLSISLMLAVLNVSTSQSVKTYQSNGSPIDQFCPNFVFDTLLNHHKEKIAVSDLKGKFIILNFFGTFCLPCIADIPKLEQLQKRFGDTLQLLMVATDGLQKAEQFYAARKNDNMPMFLPCAVNQEAVNYFKITSVSTYVWIDDKGYVKGITDHSQITEQKIAEFLRGKKLQVRQMAKDTRLDPKIPLVEAANEIDSNSVMYNSTLTKHLKGIRSTYYYPKRPRWGKLYVYNMPVRNLYQIAFGDTTGPVPYSRTVIESSHPEKIACPKEEDFELWKLNNTYCYELMVPNDKKENMQQIMQDDLNHLFGLNAFMETRTMKCLILKADKKAKFSADTSAAPQLVINTAGITIKNHPFAVFAEGIRHYHQDKIFIDETGITQRTDIALVATMNNVESCNNALKKYGLRLEYEDRPVKILVIRDPE
ncbi:redoxin domain-containing protein [Longitalea luteola]|uniref:redoxin domain-containing protein n=1 Tax=Longitalea luteola TaxID=2812563 RepID=UPI001A9612A0|nr:redoxin domain-containing protein [Longitalea luteola]